MHPEKDALCWIHDANMESGSDLPHSDGGAVAEEGPGLDLKCERVGAVIAVKLNL